MEINIRTIDPETYRNMLDDAIWSNPKQTLAIDLGHSQIHFQSENVEKEMLKRIIEENKENVSVFTSKENAMDMVQNASSFVVDKIAAWMTEERTVFSDPKDYHELAIDVNMQEETGITMNRQLEERHTDSVRLILRRDYSEAAPFGFRLETAYPLLSEHNHEEPFKVLSPKEVVANHQYEFETTISRTAFLCSGQKDIDVRLMRDKDHNDYIRFKTKERDEQYIAYLHPENLKIFRFQGENGKERLTPEQLEEDCPKLTAILKDALYYQRGGMSFEESMEYAMSTEEKEMDPITEEQIEKITGIDVGAPGFRPDLRDRPMSNLEESQWEHRYGMDIGSVGLQDDSWEKEFAAAEAEANSLREKHQLQGRETPIKDLDITD